jgi:hypothetical protein
MLVNKHLWRMIMRIMSTVYVLRSDIECLAEFADRRLMRPLALGQLLDIASCESTFCT